MPPRQRCFRFTGLPRTSTKAQKAHKAQKVDHDQSYFVLFVPYVPFVALIVVHQERKRVEAGRQKRPRPLPLDQHLDLSRSLVECCNALFEN